MRWLARNLWEKLDRSTSRHNRARPRATANRSKLELEALEDRTLLAANATGAFSGFAFVDSNNNGVREAAEAALAGVPVTLSGAANSGSAVNVSVSTDANGAYQFQNVQLGTYQLSAGPAVGFLGGSSALGSDSATGVTIVSGLQVTGGETTSRDFGFRGLAPDFISMRQFQSATTIADFPSASAGAGTTQVGDRENNAPVVKSAISNVTGSPGGSDSIIDLAGHFDDPDITNSAIKFDTSAGAINVELFDKQAPQTVANFFNYITSNRYDNSIFHRLATAFVLQGGGFTFAADPSRLVTVPADPSIANEFGQTNAQGTIAMAKLGGDPNSATSEFFFNLANNAANLDNQNGGFTVFGKLVGAADQQVVNTFASFPVSNQAKDAATSAFNEIPLLGYNGSNFPTDTSAANYALIKDVSIERRTEVLTYSVVSNSAPNLVTATIENNRLRLHQTEGAVGSATIVIRATDKFGASVDTSFTYTSPGASPS